MSDIEPKRATIVLSDDALTVQGKRLASPITESILIEALGPPDRILEGNPPAPAGHRNNQAYIYDEIGVYWLRDHKTRLMMELTVVFRQGAGPFRIPFMPLHAFGGTIQLVGCTIDSQTSSANLQRELQGAVKHFVGGVWAGYMGPFHVSFAVDRSRPSAQPGREGDLISVSIGFRRLSDLVTPVQVT
ncbi:MAG TPA: hypothetical protein VHX86_10825 [Tepidisphaeraceae bacterium]|jgi:hypothetical protein|nr:hypothetical protein [Tepidisphaeraceae bacterium]